MAMVKVKFVHRYRDRHGAWRTYLRKPGMKRVALPDLSDPGFLRAYEKAMAVPKPAIGAGHLAAGSLSALIAAWYGSTGYKTLAASTRIVYRNIAERFRADHGDKRVAALEPRHVRKLMADKSDTPEAANKLLSILRLLMRFAVTDDWRKDDPTLGVRKIRTKSEGFHTWDEEEIAQYERRWPLGSRERLAFALLLFTGQRRGDVVRLGRQHMRDGVIDLVQAKTRARVTIPVHSALVEALTAHRSIHLTFLTTGAGAAFSAAGFGNWFRECCRSASLPEHCSAHGLRKAACRRLAEAGCSAHEIMAVTGHKTLEEVERYTRQADRKRLARSAITALERPRESKAGTKLANQD